MISDQTEAALKAFLKDKATDAQLTIVKRAVRDLLSNNGSAVRLWKGIADEQQAKVAKLEAKAMGKVKLQAKDAYKVGLRRVSSIALAALLLLSTPALAEPVQIGQAVTIQIGATVVSMCEIDATSAYCDGEKIEPTSITEECGDEECTYMVKVVNY